jgi:putative SOS response-associated peptidase YedK
MCCRYTRTVPQDELERLFHFQLMMDYFPRYNIAPNQPSLVVRTDGFAMLNWGLVPRWAKAGSMASHGLVNARCETVDEKPSFREAIAHRRCLVPADGFIEWPMGKSSSKKQPYWLRLATGQPFAFAGIWEENTFAIITTDANELVRTIHDRMPVILRPHQFASWLNPASTPEDRRPLYQPFPSELMVKIPVNPILNHWRNESPEFLKPMEPIKTPKGLFDDLGTDP